jgi:hypothetical protein
MPNNIQPLEDVTEKQRPSHSIVSSEPPAFVVVVTLASHKMSSTALQPLVRVILISVSIVLLPPSHRPFAWWGMMVVDALWYLVPPSPTGPQLITLRNALRK